VTSRQPAQVKALPESSSALANQLLRLHAERSGDLLDRHITQVVAWSEREQHVAMAVVPKPQVFVLSRHDLVAVALEKSSHLACANWRQRESFLFSHYNVKCRSLRFARARARSLEA
jgi:hypothetical protein